MISTLDQLGDDSRPVSDIWLTPEREKHHKFDSLLAKKYGATLAAAAFMLEEACVKNVGKADDNKDRYKRKGRHWQRWTAKKVLELCPYLLTEKRAWLALCRLSRGPRSFFIRSKRTGLNVGSDRAVYYALRNKAADRKLHTFLVEDAVEHGVDVAAVLCRARHWWRSANDRYALSGDAKLLGPDGCVEHKFVIRDLLKMQPYQKRRSVYRMISLFNDDPTMNVRTVKISARRIEVYIRPASAKPLNSKPDPYELHEFDRGYLPVSYDTPRENSYLSDCPQQLSDLRANMENGMPDGNMECQDGKCQSLQHTIQEGVQESRPAVQRHRSKPAVASLPSALPLEENNSKITPATVVAERPVLRTLYKRTFEPKVTSNAPVDRSKYYTKVNPALAAIAKQAAEVFFQACDNPKAVLRPVWGKKKPS